MPDADARFRDDEPRRTSCAAPRPSGARQVLAMPLEGVKNFLVTLVSVKRVDRPGSTVWDAAATVVASRQLPSGRMGPLGAIGGGTIAPPPAHARRTPHGSVALCWGTPCGRALAQHSSDTSVTFAQESDRVFALATRFLPPAAREFAHPSTTQENRRRAWARADELVDRVRDHLVPAARRPAPRAAALRLAGRRAGRTAGARHGHPRGRRVRRPSGPLTPRRDRAALQADLRVLPIRRETRDAPA